MTFWEIIKYVILGFVQGASEILPISSSGHIIIFKALLGITDLNITFSIFLHCASLIAAIIFLRKKIWEVLKGTYLYIFKNNQECKPLFHYFMIMVLSTAITGVVGIFVQDTIDSWGTLLFVGIALLVNGIWLLIVGRFKANDSIDKLPYWKALIIGIGQTVGALPGISRSGATLGTSLAVGIKKEDAAEYAFMLFLPVTAGATILSLDDFAAFDKAMMIPYILGFIVAGLTTYFALKVFLKVIKNKKLDYFAFYCFIAGILSIIFSIA